MLAKYIILTKKIQSRNTFNACTLDISRFERWQISELEIPQVGFICKVN